MTTVIPYTPKDYHAEALAPQALAGSTGLARLCLTREDAVAAFRVARSQTLPDISATFGLTDLGETEGPAVSSGWLAGVTMTVPFFDRQLQETADHAERALEVLDQQIVAAQDQVTQQVQRQVRAATSARARIDIEELSVELAKKNREATQGMYDEGLTDYLHVLDADTRLVAAQSTLLQDQVQYFLTTVQVRRALSEDITQGLPE